MTNLSILLLVASIAASCHAWVMPTAYVARSSTRQTQSQLESSLGMVAGSKHGENSCFLPLEQLDQDYYAPRIIQIAGAYPGLTREEYESVTSEEAAEPGQWTYDFSDPDGPQMGTVALPGSNVVACCQDPVVIIAEHYSLGVPLPRAITEPVDLIVLADRAEQTFAERRFLILDIPGEQGIKISAFQTKAEVPAGAQILGQVVLVQIPWLSCMKPTKSGFLEADEYF